MLGLFAPPPGFQEEALELLVACTDGSISAVYRRRAPRASSPLCATALALQERVETAKNSQDSHFCKLCEGVRPQVLCWAEQGALPAGCSPLDPLSVGAVAQARRATERTHSAPPARDPGLPAGGAARPWRPRATPSS